MRAPFPASPHQARRSLLAIGLLAMGVLPASVAGAAGLPDGRAYELVSPPHKLADFAIADSAAAAWATADGSRILYSPRLSGMPSGDYALTVAERRAGGWVSTPAVTYDRQGEYTFLSGRAATVSPDLSALAQVAFPGGSLNASTVPSQVLIVRPGVGTTTLAEVPGDLARMNTPTVVGASDDLSHVFWQQSFNAPLDPSAVDPPATGVSPTALVLYEWDHGTRRIVAANPDGSIMNDCGAVLANADTQSSNGYINAVSRDGSTAFLRIPDPGAWDPSCAGPSLLYVRTGSSPTPRLISKPESGVSDPAGPQPAIFAGAPADGSKAFFVTTERLTAADATGGSDLYEYDVASDQLKLVTLAPDGTANAGITYVMVSDDGSTAYVVTQRPMVTGTGVDGSPNLYRYDIATGDWSFIATLSNDDAARVSNSGPGGFNGPWVESGWYTTSNGRFLIFKSNLDLPGTQPQVGFRIYRYDAESGEVRCVSCVPGVTPTGDAQWGGQTLGRINRYNRPITDDGHRVFFDSPDQLVPADANNARDVYEWHDGEISLISGGTDRSSADVITASTDGRDVFFSTHQRLVPEDQDDLIDIYDARIGGGFGRAATAPGCQGSGCTAAASPPLSLGKPASSNVFGPGNLVPRRRVTPSVTVGKVSAAARRRAARTGVLALRIRTTTAGRVSAMATARVRGLRAEVARASRSVKRAGTITARLRLNRAARLVLASHRTLRLSVAVRLSGASRTRTVSVSLRRPR